MRGAGCVNERTTRAFLQAARLDPMRATAPRSAAATMPRSPRPPRPTRSALRGGRINRRAPRRPRRIGGLARLLRAIPARAFSRRRFRTAREDGGGQAVVNARFVMRLMILLLGLWSGLAGAAEFSAEVDRRTVALHEPVVLTLSLTNSDTRLRAEGVSPNVDLSALAKDFDVGMPEVSNRYNVYQGRGRSTSEIRVELCARRAGTITLPAFRLEGMQTKPITLTVRALPANEMPEVFSRGGVTKHEVWQREQFVAWLDVYHRVQLKSASVGEYIDTEPTRIELLEHRELPQGEREEEVQGTRYGVTRIAWAIYSKESGELKVVLPDVWIVTADGRKLRLPHQPEVVHVRALPATVTDDIAVGAPQLEQTAPTPAPGVNQLSTWTVTVRGGFSRFALPDTLPLPPVPARIKLYADRAARSSEVKPDGVITIVVYSLSALPEEQGRYTLPAVRVPYFDTSRGAVGVEFDARR